MVPACGCMLNVNFPMAPHTSGENGVKLLCETL